VQLQKLRFLYIVGTKDKQVIDNLYIKKKAYNFSLATCNEASLGLIGILAIGPFN
jgi:hypothetical protein